MKPQEARGTEQGRLSRQRQGNVQRPCAGGRAAGGGGRGEHPGDTSEAGACRGRGEGVGGPARQAQVRAST